MNIKIIYNTKTHKISQKHQTLQEIRKSIQNLYPQQLQNGFDIIVSLHPQMVPYKILEENSFLKIKELYNQMKWQSIKFLVKDSINPNLTNDDLLILNQSVISQSTVELSTLNEIFKQQQQPKQEEVQKVQNQKQQIIKEQIKQETNITLDIINKIDKQEFQGIDFNSEEFKNFILERIDDRLKYHGIFETYILQSQLQQYRMELITRDFFIQKFIDEKFVWEVQIKNTGDVIWKKNKVFLMAIEGFYKDDKFQLENDVNPGEIAIFKCNYKMPTFEFQNYKTEFSMVYYFEQNKIIEFGEKIPFVITSWSKHDFNQKVEQLMESLSFERQKAIKIIQMYGPKESIVDIILACIEQPK